MHPVQKFARWVVDAPLTSYNAKTNVVLFVEPSEISIKLFFSMAWLTNIFLYLIYVKVSYS